MSPRSVNAPRSPRRRRDRERQINEGAISESFRPRLNRKDSRFRYFVALSEGKTGGCFCRKRSSEHDHGRNSNGKIGNVPVLRAGALMAIEPELPFVTALKLIGIGWTGHGIELTP